MEEYELTPISPDETALVVLSKTTKSIIKMFDLSPQKLFDRIQCDIAGESGDSNAHLTEIIHLYLAELIAKEVGIPREEIEDFLSQVLSIKKQLRLHETDLYDLGPSSEEVVEEYCDHCRSRNTDETII